MRAESAGQYELGCGNSDVRQPRDGDSEVDA